MARHRTIVTVGSAMCLAVALIVLGTVAASAALSVKKQYKADVSPHSVSTGATVTFTATITNEAASQSLGSCNLTAPSGFTLQTTSQPSPQGSATVAGNILQLRNLSAMVNAVRTVSFVAKAPATPGTYTWAIDCRQANNYNPDQPSNQFSLDAAASNLKTTVSTPLPSADLAVTSNVDSPDPVVGANTVEYSVVVHNNGPATSGAVTLTDSLPAGGSITSVDGGANWTCSGSGTSQTCTHAALASGADAETVLVRVLAPNADTTITNRAATSESGASDPVGGNNTLDQNTTVTKDSSCP